MRTLIALIHKDYLVDFRQKYPVAGIVLYIFATIYISYLAFNTTISPTTWNALYWVILLFASITGISKSFSQEMDRTLYYYFLCTPSVVLGAKLIYHLIYQYFLVLLSVILFWVFLGFPVENVSLFLVNLFIGSTGIAVGFTMISSLSSKTGNPSTMMAILGFPVIIPVLLLSVTNSRQVLLGASWVDISGNAIALMSVIVIIIALSFILFPYSWRD
ncbi:MAG: heme exporter protein CcmB [Cyclobacteriaceae bacterium]|nr:heme exporter protein CcmB [Cyclobacteriaceae bacterium]